MERALEGLVCLVAGGGRREAEAAIRLASLGVRVRSFGLGAFAGPGVEPVEALEEGARGAGLLLLPVAGVGENGELPVLVGAAGAPGRPAPARLTVSALEILAPGGLVAAGVAPGWLRAECGRLGLALEEYRERDDFAILNAVATAEGAIRTAVEELPVTIHGSCALVLGFGRTGRALCRRLLLLGAHTLAAARRPEDLCRILEEGHRPVPFDRLEPAAAEADVIFNTVPAPVLGARLLERTSPDVVILDLASAPGGTDFEAAHALGRRALLLPGLPGRAAHRTGGRILADTVARLLRPARPTPPWGRG